MIRVNDIYLSIQGEGAKTGTPMVIVRLQGCSVGCSFCDTKQTWGKKHPPSEGGIVQALGENASYATVSEEELVDYCKNLAGDKITWIMLTGGEPCEQELTGLVKQFHSAGFRINLETSGSSPIPDNLVKSRDWVCVSPKYGYKNPLVKSLLRADEVKQVICKEADLDEDRLLRLQLLHNGGRIVSLQPVAGSKQAMNLCMKACLEHGFHLSIQTHKEINIR